MQISAKFTETQRDLYKLKASKNVIFSTRHLYVCIQLCNECEPFFSYYPGAESIHNDNRIEIHPMEIVDVSINCYILNS